MHNNGMYFALLQHGAEYVFFIETALKVWRVTAVTMGCCSEPDVTSPTSCLKLTNMEIDADQPGFTILTSPPIFDRIFGHCAAGTLQRIARTCRGAHEAVSDYLTHAMSAQYSQQLSRFFPKHEDLLAFRQLQANLQFLVSGSQALQLLSRSIFARTDLDLYVWPYQAMEVAKWLISRGYVHAPYHEGRTLEEEMARMTNLTEHRTDHELRYGTNGVRGILNFRKQTQGLNDDESDEDEDDEDAIEIQIIATTSSPLHTILGFHASALTPCHLPVFADSDE